MTWKIGQQVYDTGTYERGELLSYGATRCRVRINGEIVDKQTDRLRSGGGHTISASDVRLCNCAKCGAPLLGKSNPSAERLPVAYRYIDLVQYVDHRPVCPVCVDL